MKKWFFSFVAFAQALLFFVLLAQYQEADRSNVYNLFGLNQKMDRTGFVLKDPVSETERKEMLETVLATARSHGVPVIWVGSEYSQGDLTVLRYYVWGSDEQVAAMLPKGTSIPASFSEGDAKISSFETKRPEDVRLYLFSDAPKMEVLPAHEVLQDASAMQEGLSVYYEEDAKDQVVSAFSEALASHHPVAVDWENDYYRLGSEVVRALLYFFLFTGLGLLLGLFFLLSSHLKEIGIYYLHGYAASETVRRLFGPLFCFTILSGLILPILLFGCLIRVWQPRTLSFLQQVMLYTQGISLSLLLSLALAWILLRGYSYVDRLKNRNFNQKLMTITFVVSLLGGCFLLPMIEPYLQQLGQGAWPPAVFLFRERAALEQVWYGRQTFSSEVTATVAEKDTSEKERFEWLEQQGKLLYQAPTYLSALQQNGSSALLLGFVVNVSYIKEQSFFNAKGERLQIAPKKGEVLALVDRKVYAAHKWKAETFLPMEKQGGRVQVVLFDRCECTDYSLASLSPIEDTMPQTPIFLLSSPETPLYEPKFSQNTFLRLQDSSEISKWVGAEKMVWQSGKEQVAQWIRGLLQTASKPALIALPGLAVLSMAIFEMGYFYRRGGRKRQAVLASLGFSFSVGSRNLLIELLLVFVAPCLSAWRLSGSFPFHSALFLFLVTGSVWLRQWRLYTCQSIPEQLRGNE